ncbi:MAG: hypothetical protein ACFCVK_23660 [Acidimicrobiales bacterium]
MLLDADDQSGQTACRFSTTIRPFYAPLRRPSTPTPARNVTRRTGENLIA